ncbi:MAG: carboxymuconolactone decarboxylase family protein [Desulfobacterales bacterium]|jgi:alkylhydroperoxidase/carboxymuconolactone decarboxylase family protein YurZ|nr:carboxymuconolactone decarboxylase family protein [Desulfobacterales bacterium]
MFKQAGFVDIELVADTGFNSSPVTKGALFRATKPVISIVKEKEKVMEDSLSKYKEFFDQTYAEGTLDRKTKHLIALGASLAAGCEA